MLSLLLLLLLQAKLVMPLAKLETAIKSPGFSEVPDAIKKVAHEKLKLLNTMKRASRKVSSKEWNADKFTWTAADVGDAAGQATAQANLVTSLRKSFLAIG